jgi:hypothetical protein
LKVSLLRALTEGVVSNATGPETCAEASGESWELYACSLPHSSRRWSGHIRKTGEGFDAALRSEELEWTFQATLSRDSGSRAAFQSKGALIHPWRPELHYDSTGSVRFAADHCVTLEARAFVEAADGPWRILLESDSKCPQECRSEGASLRLEQPSQGVTFDLELDFKPAESYDVWGPEAPRDADYLCAEI